MPSVEIFTDAHFSHSRVEALGAQHPRPDGTRHTEPLSHPQFKDPS